MQPTPVLQRALRRLALTTKQGPHNYYKGNRTGAMGRHTKWGGYVLDYKKIRTYVCPDLTDCNMTPFVSEEEYVGEQPTLQKFQKQMNADRYLQLWKEGGGERKELWQS